MERLKKTNLTATCVDDYLSKFSNYRDKPVYEFNGFYVLKTSSKSLPLYILNEAIRYEDIESGHHYSCYYIGDRIYTGYLTNSLLIIEDEKADYNKTLNKQLSIFDFLDEGSG